jgi:hypothetical protein
LDKIIVAQEEKEKPFYEIKNNANKIAEFVKNNKGWKKNQDWKEVGNLEMNLKFYNKVKDRYPNYDDDSKMLDFYEQVVKSKVGLDILAASNLNTALIEGSLIKKKEEKFGQLLSDSKGKSILGKLKDAFKRTINWNKGSAKITPTKIITK